MQLESSRTRGSEQSAQQRATRKPRPSHQELSVSKSFQWLHTVSAISIIILMDVAITNKEIHDMKRSKILPVLIGVTFAFAAGAINAQQTRAQVKMERDDFLKSHTWDQERGTWMLKSGMEPPAGVKGRAEIKAERDAYLANNRWDQIAGNWVPLKAGPRDMSKLTREQVKMETAAFAKTHEWNQETDTYVMKKAK